MGNIIVSNTPGMELILVYYSVLEIEGICIKCPICCGSFSRAKIGNNSEWPMTFLTTTTTEQGGVGRERESGGWGRDIQFHMTNHSEKIATQVAAIARVCLNWSLASHKLRFANSIKAERTLGRSYGTSVLEYQRGRESGRENIPENRSFTQNFPILPKPGNVQ